jgi:hypothetical protein
MQKHPHSRVGLSDAQLQRFADDDLALVAAAAMSVAGDNSNSPEKKSK